MNTMSGKSTRTLARFFPESSLDAVLIV